MPRNNNKQSSSSSVFDPLAAVPLPEGEEQIFHYEISDTEREQLFQAARMQATHHWVQRGSQIMCDNCDLEHGFTVEWDVKLEGTDERGMPKFGRFNV